MNLILRSNQFSKAAAFKLAFQSGANSRKMAPKQAGRKNRSGLAECPTQQSLLSNTLPLTEER